MIDFHEIRLIAKMRAGGPEAYTEIYDRYAARLMSYALRVTGDRAEAEDLLQETILAAWHGRETFHGNARLLSWLLGIMSRRWRDRCRHRQVTTVSLTMEGDEIELPASVRAGARLETGVIERLSLDAALAVIDLPFREALLLIHSQQLTYKEAAEILGEPVGTVKWRVSEALKRVHRQLAACEEEIDELRQTSAGAVG
jgi:RNA polymerase sigma-70 factor (ECF subfamily)